MGRKGKYKYKENDLKKCKWRERQGTLEFHFLGFYSIWSTMLSAMKPTKRCDSRLTTFTSVCLGDVDLGKQWMRIGNMKDARGKKWNSSINRIKKYMNLVQQQILKLLLPHSVFPSNSQFVPLSKCHDFFLPPGFLHQLILNKRSFEQEKNKRSHVTSQDVNRPDLEFGQISFLSLTLSP